MKKKKVTSRKPASPKRTRQSELVVKIIAIGLGMFVVLLARDHFIPSQDHGQFLGISTFLAVAEEPQTDTTEETGEAVRIKVYTQDGKLIMAELDKEDRETLLDSAQMEKVKDQLSTKHIAVSPLNDTTLTIQRGNVATITELPLIIDESDYSYTVLTSTGKTMVTYLPNDVIQNLIRDHVLDLVQTSENTNPAGNVRLVIKLEQDQSGSAIFIVKGKRIKKLFGLFQVAVEKTVTISSQSGDVLTEELTSGNRLMNLLSI